MGEFGPLGYILAHQIADAQPVAAFGDKNGKPDTYTAGIWVKKGSPITTLKQLAGKTLALVEHDLDLGRPVPDLGADQRRLQVHGHQLPGPQGQLRRRPPGDPAGAHPRHGRRRRGQQPAAGLGDRRAPVQRLRLPRDLEVDADHQRPDHASTATCRPRSRRRSRRRCSASRAAQTATVDTELGTTNNGPMVAADRRALQPRARRRQRGPSDHQGPRIDGRAATPPASGIDAHAGAVQGARPGRSARDRGDPQALRVQRGAQGRQPDARAAASCWRCSAATAAASRRCCAARSGCSTPTRAAHGCAAATSPRLSGKALRLARREAAVVFQQIALVKRRTRARQRLLRGARAACRCGGR